MNRPTRADLQSLADQKAQQYGIPPELFRGMITQESGWNPRIVSNKGAAGLGQLMPGTAAGLGVKDRFDPEANLDGSARYLKQQYDRFGSWDLALAAYNAGPGAVQKAGDQIPRIRETENYVASILGGLEQPPQGQQVQGQQVQQARAAPSALPWWLDHARLDALRPPEAPPSAKGPAAVQLPWWLDSQRLDALRGTVDQPADSPVPPLPAPTIGFTPSQGLPQQIAASFPPTQLPAAPGPSFAAAPTAAPAPPRAPAAPSLAGTLLAGALAGPGGNAAQVGAGLSRGQVALPPNPTAPAGLPLAASQRVQQIQGSATGPLAEAIQRYAAQTGGRSYVQDLLMRYRLAPDPVSRQAVLNEAGAYGLGPQIAQIASSLPPSV
jgi:hypothetical protein